MKLTKNTLNRFFFFVIKQIIYSQLTDINQLKRRL